MSATLDEQSLADIFDVEMLPHTLFMKLSNKTKPNYEIIGINDEQKDMDILEYSLSIIKKKESVGKNILIFLPGKPAIDDFVANIKQVVPENIYVDGVMSITVTKVFNELVEPYILCATNVLESGRTLPNLDIVIDSGLETNVSWDPTSGVKIINTIYRTELPKLLQ